MNKRGIKKVLFLGKEEIASVRYVDDYESSNGSNFQNIIFQTGVIKPKETTVFNVDSQFIMDELVYLDGKATLVVLRGITDTGSFLTPLIRNFQNRITTLETDSKYYEMLLVDLLSFLVKKGVPELRNEWLIDSYEMAKFARQKMSGTQTAETQIGIDVGKKEKKTEKKT